MLFLRGLSPIPPITFKVVLVRGNFVVENKFIELVSNQSNTMVSKGMIVVILMQ